MAEEFFGEHIDRDPAERYFQKFMDIKRRSLPKIQQALEGDEEALRYYCGREGMNPLEEDWAFVFDNHSLNRMRTSIENHGADGVFIFYAAKDVSGLPPAPTPNPNDVDGRPTLMIFPYKHHDPAVNSGIEFELFLDDGEQHPGTGGGSVGDYKGGDKLPGGFTEDRYAR